MKTASVESNTLREVNGLRPHPLRNQTLGDAIAGESLKPIKASVSCLGILDPLKVTTEGLIVDGVLRWQAAKALGIQQVPAITVTDLDAASIIVHSLIARRHYNSGQLAYLVEPLTNSAFEAARQRRHANLQNLRQAPIFSAKTVEEWAECLGISVNTLKRARQLRQLFKDETKRTLTDRDGVSERGVTLRAFFEPRLLSDYGDGKPYGLGALIAGIESILAAERRGGQIYRPPTEDRQLELLCDAFTGTLGSRASYWDKLDNDAKAKVKQVMVDQFNELPEEFLAEIARNANTALKRRRREELPV